MPRSRTTPTTTCSRTSRWRPTTSGPSLVKPGGLGVIEFCFGGRIALLSGARFREVDAVVTFHPGAVTAAEVARLQSPVQVHSGTADRQVSVSQIEGLRKLLEAQSTPVEVFYYEGADHGFLAYTRPFYRPDHAQLAWKRATEFLARNLR